VAARGSTCDEKASGVDPLRDRVLAQPNGRTANVLQRLSPGGSRRQAVLNVHYQVPMSGQPAIEGTVLAFVAMTPGAAVDHDDARRAPRRRLWAVEVRLESLGV
jgi:hypothetical protein